ncbi:heme-binding protein [Thiohalophilus sp.]|uniref:GlcG/HbpS family heme-binding protein n=1 Tax=Thiohalophilus sp. TaxID=3028392 RepID=UPI002ACDAC94|nr:heme-binding protein [Thiohalophilus sp.]MDZ7805434.1 heme-binding protein [Thiohalophilus sp.]
MRTGRYGVYLAGALLLAALPLQANEVISVKRITMDLAAEIAGAAVKDCREKGYQVSAVVVDRNGNTQMAMRDTLASRFTLQIAEEKANLVIMSGIPSGQFRGSRQDIRQELNHIDGIVVMDGGLPVQAAGTNIAAIGVSGAPGGDIDAECAARGIAAVQDRLDFIE